MYTHIFDRSNLDDVVCITKEKRHMTRRECLEEEPDTGFRKDIVLFNATRSGRVYVIEVGKDRLKGDLFVLDFLSDAEYEQVLGIAERMRENARTFLPARKLLA